MTTDHAYDTLVLIPAYNAARHLPDLIPRLRTYVCDSNLLVVNDGSTDTTESILVEHGIRHLFFPANRGKGAALRAGFTYAIDNGYRSVLTLDADLQHPPESLPAFYAIDNGRTLAIGTRRINHRSMPLSRRWSNNLTSLIVSIFSARRIRDSQSGYRLIPVELLRHVRLTSDRFDLESQLLFQAGAFDIPIVEVPIDTVYTGAGSHISHVADTARFIRQIWRRIWQ
ncbi:glycosyltransferase family 2 protein [bacterium]|nr:glycosyltransferase family 2 protein [bacterium]MCB2202205.1 glycosyltransferase family 2 protein [bacterium]